MERIQKDDHNQQWTLPLEANNLKADLNFQVKDPRVRDDYKLTFVMILLSKLQDKNGS